MENNPKNIAPGQLQFTGVGQRGYDQLAAHLFNYEENWRSIMVDNEDGRTIQNNVGTLRHEDHQSIMDQLVQIRRRSLNGVADLRAFGLTSPEDIGTQLVGREAINEFQSAAISMNPVALQNNQSDFTLVYTPLPIIHSSWRIPFRQIGFGYKRSAGLSESVRQVAEKMEDLLFNGDTSVVVTVSGTNTTIQGYTTLTNRETYTITDWTDLSTNREKIVPETLDGLGDLFSNGGVSAPNSVMMYVANNFWNYLQDDYSLTHGGPATFVDRLKQISQIIDVKPAEKLAASKTLLIEMSDRAVELVMASDIVTVPHIRTSNLDDQVFTTYAVVTPILKTDRNSKTGIAHGGI
jgi:hypothetical protein|tara:strand:- start:4208 stop:5257 length:1050 start_codon:yes stop_codon:yes gene_type:complete